MDKTYTKEELNMMNDFLQDFIKNSIHCQSCKFQNYYGICFFASDCVMHELKHYKYIEEN